LHFFGGAKMAGVANLKEIQKRIQDKDYETAYSLCVEALKSSTSSSPNMNLFIMHGSCAFQLEKYSEAEKSFREAIALDTNEQFKQKLWKVLLPSLSLFTPSRILRISTKSLRTGKD
jgi:tetratricopeptide (TPR) repeat protein